MGLSLGTGEGKAGFELRKHSTSNQGSATNISGTGREEEVSSVALGKRTCLVHRLLCKKDSPLPVDLHTQCSVALSF